MSAWALIVSGVVVEITTVNPAGRFNPALEWVECDGTPGVAQGWSYANGTFSAPPAAPAPTLAQQAEALLGAGFQVISTSTPALNGTYPADALSQQHIMAEVTSILLNGTFTDGSTTIAWEDVSGTSHSMTVAQYKAWATAHGAFTTAALKCINGQSTALPAQPSTIA